MGISGLAGTNGTNGINGTLGARGADGDPGLRGTDGAPGKDGIDGAPGTPGINGINGKDGTPGTNGINGTPGIDGTNGIDGIDGKNGPSGTAIGDLQWWNGTAWTMLTAGAHNTHLNSCESVPTWVVTDCPAGFAIGDTGPGGGIVFYITDGGVHGLEAAPVDQTASAWGCSGTAIAGTSTAVGTGQANTALIVAGCADVGTAAKVADAYSIGSFDDWYLPSKDELALLYPHKKDFVDEFIDSEYSSSSESSNDDAWYQNFLSGGTQNSYLKSDIAQVRAIRSF
jgi:hypothetical protein